MVEIAEAVVAWNRGLLAPLAGRPLDDPRVTVRVADLVAWLADERACGRYDRQPEPALVTELAAAFARATGRAVPVTVAGHPSEDYLLVATT